MDNHYNLFQHTHTQPILLCGYIGLLHIVLGLPPSPVVYAADNILIVMPFIIPASFFSSSVI